MIPAGFEPTTRSLEGCCSIQLSYETIAKSATNVAHISKNYTTEKKILQQGKNPRQNFGSQCPQTLTLTLPLRWYVSRCE